MIGLILNHYNADITDFSMPRVYAFSPRIILITITVSAISATPTGRATCQSGTKPANKYTAADTEEAIAIWNDVVRDGVAFPQTEELDAESGRAFFESQSFTGIAKDMETGVVVGLYILHPNNIGRCGHICNASYAVWKNCRGRHIGELLVKDCMAQAKKLGFKILQFNAVVATNVAALKLYARLGFVQLGVIPGGFLMKDGHYEDIIPHYHLL